MKFLTLTTLLFLNIFTGVSFAVTISELSPVHSRPYLLSQTHKHQILKLIENRPWAQKDFNQIQARADSGDGYSAAFLYALTDEQRYFQTARNWLLNVADSGGDLGHRALEADAEFFKQGMPWLGDVYYNLDTRPLKAFDYIYNDLSSAEREQIQAGLAASASFRKNAMDTWWQTPNLVFKPTSMVAIHGLLTQDPAFMDWGFFRQSRTNLGGYFPSLNSMLKDNGPWNEAPIYAVSHRPLSLSLEISDYLNRLTGRDWFNRKLDDGSSVRGLMDYYINTTYPAETRPNGNKAYRLLTYGDGATGQRGDMYLLSDNPHQRNLKNELASAYRISLDPDYAAFLKLDNHYQPDLINQPPLPISPLLPAASSSIWKDFGLAFLRSDNSRGYWHNPDAMATSLIFRQGYGHGHSDALSMTYFAAGQLFYPDYNAVQYENPAIGWTASSIAHNTVVVDGMNSALPKHVETFHDFSGANDVVQARVNEPMGLEKVRTLALTPNYLLDIFHVNSLTARTFDYLLHSFAKIQPGADTSFSATTAFSPRYNNINDFNSFTTDAAWSLNYLIDLQQHLKRQQQLVDQFSDSKTNRQQIKSDFGIDNTDLFKASGLHFQMAASPHTTIGIGNDNYDLSFLAARRENIKQTTFIALHSPFYGNDPVMEYTLETLSDTRTGTVVKVTTDTSIDIHAISHGEGKTRLSNADATLQVEFSGYAFLSINKSTLETRQNGNWHRYSLAKQITGLNQIISAGEINSDDFSSYTDNTASIQINTYPERVVLKDFADSSFTLSVTNLTNKTLKASATLNKTSTVDPPKSEFPLGLIPAYQTYATRINLGRYAKPAGMDTLPIHINLDDTGQSVSHGILVSAGPGLVENYNDINNPSYRIHTFKISTDIAMRDGAITRLLDNQGMVIYSGQPLFYLSDGHNNYSSLDDTIKASYTWPNKEHASVITEINNHIRWHLLTIQDRFYLKLDDVYTRPETVSFVFDKGNPAIDWQLARYLADGESRLLSLNTSNSVSAKAIELPLKNSTNSICINNLASGQWLNSETKLALLLKRNNNEQWSFGLCKYNGLPEWVN